MLLLHRYFLPQLLLSSVPMQNYICLLGVLEEILHCFVRISYLKIHSFTTPTILGVSQSPVLTTAVRHCHTICIPAFRRFPTLLVQIRWIEDKSWSSNRRKNECIRGQEQFFQERI